jgi:hypothetical protein
MVAVAAEVGVAVAGRHGGCLPVAQRRWSRLCCGSKLAGAVEDRGAVAGVAVVAGRGGMLAVQGQDWWGWSGCFGRIRQQGPGVVVAEAGLGCSGGLMERQQYRWAGARGATGGVAIDE